MKYTEEQVLEWLHEVKDPEIPVLSLVDLGVITQVDVSQEHHVRVQMTPTFSGCPALEHMRQGVEDTLRKYGVSNPDVFVSYDIPWTSDRISEQGRVALKQFGLAPPHVHGGQVDIDILSDVACPYCGSQDTVVKSFFGPTLCRALHYCNSCRQAFEQFKPL